MTVVTRFAPSPSGRLHLGHAHAALFAWRAAERAGGGCLLRIEDIDVGRFFRVVKKSDAGLKPFGTFLNGNSARCGKIRDSQREFLFKNDADEIGSAALVPLGEGSDLGFLAVGSVDSDRFHPGMSIDFLARLGDLVAGSLKRF